MIRHTPTQWRLKFKNQTPFKTSFIVNHLQDATKGPDVHLKTVAFFAEHFGGDVVRRATQRLLPLTIKLNLGGQAKIT